MKLNIHGWEDKGKEFLIINRKTIGQERDSIQPMQLPKIQFDPHLFKSCRSIKRIIRKTTTKIIQRLRIKKMFMSRVSVGMGAGKMRDSKKDLSPILANSVNLFHGPNHIVYMLQDVNAVDLVKNIVLKGIGKDIQVMKDIGLRFRVPVQSQGPLDLPVAATDVQYFHKSSP